MLAKDPTDLSGGRQMVFVVSEENTSAICSNETGYERIRKKAEVEGADT